MLPDGSAAPAPRWPIRLRDLCAEATRARAEGRPCDRAGLWTLLRDVLLTALCRELPAHSALVRDDLEDLASEKALDLLCRAERGEWDLSGRSAGEIANYIRSTARHGMLRLGERRRRQVPLDPDPGADPSSSGEWADPHAGPEPLAEARDFVDSLVGCLGTLRPRSRRVWVLRAVHEMNSRRIASHPDVRTSEANVDVILLRARSHIRECLASKGHEPGGLPAGTFTRFWVAMRLDHARPGQVMEELET